MKMLVYLDGLAVLIGFIGILVITEPGISSLKYLLYFSNNFLFRTFICSYSNKTII